MLAYDRVQLPELGNQRSTILCQLFHLQAGFLVVDVVLETENSFVSGKNREKSRELSFFHLPLWLYQKMEYIRRKFKGSHYCARINLCDVIKLSHGALGNSRSWCGGHGERYCQYKAKTELFFPAFQLFEREDENIDICCEHDVLMVFMYSMNQRIENDSGNNLNCWRLP